MTLNRELGLFGATMMGLGSIIGTGVFVSIGITTGIASSAVFLLNLLLGLSRVLLAMRRRGDMP